MRYLALIIGLFVLVGCDALDETRVLLLKCDSTPLDENFRCPNIKRTGAVLSVRVNPATQKVQVTTVESNADWFPGTRILDNCSVVDANNWVCGSESKLEIKSIVGMFRGHLYTSVQGGLPPNYYSSSISGWRLKLVEWGFIDHAQAQKLE